MNVVSEKIDDVEKDNPVQIENIEEIVSESEQKDKLESKDIEVIPKPQEIEDNFKEKIKRPRRRLENFKVDIVCVPKQVFPEKSKKEQPLKSVSIGFKPEEVLEELIGQEASRIKPSEKIDEISEEEKVITIGKSIGEYGGLKIYRRALKNLNGLDFDKGFWMPEEVISETFVFNNHDSIHRILYISQKDIYVSRMIDGKQFFLINKINAWPFKGGYKERKGKERMCALESRGYNLERVRKILRKEDIFDILYLIKTKKLKREIRKGKEIYVKRKSLLNYLKKINKK